MENEKTVPGTGTEERVLIHLEKDAGSEYFSRDIQASSPESLMFGMGILINEIAIAAQATPMAIIARIAVLFQTSTPTNGGPMVQ